MWRQKKTYSVTVAPGERFKFQRKIHAHSEEDAAEKFSEQYMVELVKDYIIVDVQEEEERKAI